MMIRTGRAARIAVLALALPVLGGCMGMGWEDVMRGIPTGGDLRGDVSWVDQRRREIGVRSGWGGDQSVRYDSRTRVVGGGRNMRVTDLRRGDPVRIQVSSSSRGARVARTVQVERNVRSSDRDRANARSRNFDGRVSWMDRDRARFGMTSGRYGYTVHVPSRSTGEMRRQMDRLRRGARVRFEGVERGGGVIELRRFR